MTILDVWHRDDGSRRVSIVYDGMRDSTSISFADSDGGTMVSEMGLSDTVSLRDFAGCMGDSSWSMDSDGVTWFMESSEGALVVGCSEEGTSMEARFPRGCIHDLFRVLDRRWGVYRCSRYRSRTVVRSTSTTRTSARRGSSPSTSYRYTGWSR